MKEAADDPRGGKTTAVTHEHSPRTPPRRHCRCAYRKCNKQCTWRGGGCVLCGASFGSWVLFCLAVSSPLVCGWHGEEHPPPPPPSHRLLPTSMSPKVEQVGASKVKRSSCTCEIVGTWWKFISLSKKRFACFSFQWWHCSGISAMHGKKEKCDFNLRPTRLHLFQQSTTITLSKLARWSQNIWPFLSFFFFYFGFVVMTPQNCQSDGQE